MSLQFDLITLFPEMFAALDYGIVGRARKNRLIQVDCWNPRDYCDNPHGQIDDKPYGGGPGMVMMASPIKKTLDAIQQQHQPKATVIYLSPRGQTIKQKNVENMANLSNIVLLCGRYEGIDERLLTSSIDEHWSIGDYVLSGGEIPSMVLIDAITRLLPGALGDASSAQQESFQDDRLEHPHYTRPAEFDGMTVPDVLLSGDHQAIARWRLQQSLGYTHQHRPDLLNKVALTPQQQQLLDTYIDETKR